MLVMLDVGQECHRESLVGNKTYCVYGISFGSEGKVILCDEMSEIPMFYPMSIFSIVDRRVSRVWVLGDPVERKNAEGINFTSYLLTFAEWASRPFFYDDFVEGRGDSSQVFRRYKQFMDLEFARPEITRSTTNLRDNWVQCTECANSWQVDRSMELAVCPACSTIQRVSALAKRK